MNIFKLSQQELFVYYCAYFRQMEYSNLKGHTDHPVVDIVYVSSGGHEDAKAIANRNGLLVRALRIDPDKLVNKDASLIEMLETMKCFAIFDDRENINLAVEEAYESAIGRYEKFAKGCLNFPEWTYLLSRGQKNLQPPLLKPQANVYSLDDLRAYAIMEMDNNPVLNVPRNLIVNWQAENKSRIDLI